MKKHNSKPVSSASASYSSFIGSNKATLRLDSNANAAKLQLPLPKPSEHDLIGPKLKNLISFAPVLAEKLIIGSGVYVKSTLRQFKLVGMGAEFNTRKNAALAQGHPNDEAMVCSALATGAQTVTASYGSAMVVRDATAMIVASRGQALVPAIVYGTVGFGVVNTVSENTGNFTQSACHQGGAALRNLKAQFLATPQNSAPTNIPNLNK